MHRLPVALTAAALSVLAPTVRLPLADAWQPTARRTVIAAPRIGPAATAPVVPLRRLVGRYLLVKHKADPVPALVFADSAYREVLLAGTLDIRPDGTFSLRYTTRTTMRTTDEIIETPVELIGRVSSTRAGIRLTVTADSGEPAEEPWSVNATVVRGVMTVTFEDGNIEVMGFRRR